MEEIYLEDARNLFLNPPDNIIYEGMGCKEFELLINLIGYIIPNRVTPNELVDFIKILISDIKEKRCGFKNSVVFSKKFEIALEFGSNIDFWKTYIPSFLYAVTPSEFAIEAIRIFGEKIYRLKLDDSDVLYGFTEVSEDVIDISNKDKAEVLAELYNHSRPIGIGIANYDFFPMDVEEARLILEQSEGKFSYLKGRIMHVNFNSDFLYVGAYNRDNCIDGLAQLAISKCKNLDDEVEPQGYKM